MTNAAASPSKREIESIRAQFPVLNEKVQNGKRLVYFDNGASTLRCLPAIDRVDHYYRHETSNVHRGAHFLSSQATVAYEAARESVQKFIGARSASEIIFTRGTTESINLVAQSFGRSRFQAGDEIIVSELEHHSNIVPWQLIAEERGCTIKVVPMLDSGDLDLAAFKSMLSLRTKMVALTWCSNTLGNVVPVTDFIASAHAVGAKVLLDAAQVVAHQPINVASMNCDFLAFSGHKIFAPNGIGVLFGKEDLLNAMPPYQGGGSMISEVTFQRSTYLPVPMRFEAGTPNISGALGLAAAIQYIQELGWDLIHARESLLLTKLIAGLKSVAGVHFFPKLADWSAPRATIVSFGIDGVHPTDLGSLLDLEGVAIRTGHHCTQPLMRRLGVTATARASLSFYNTEEEIEIFIRALQKAKEFF